MYGTEFYDEDFEGEYSDDEYSDDGSGDEYDDNDSDPADGADNELTDTNGKKTLDLDDFLRMEGIQ